MMTTTIDAATSSSVLNETLDRLTQQILATTDTSRADRLWPADPIVFQTNPLSLAYGACGTALFLRERLGSVPPHVMEWICAQPVDNASYPPGMYSGVAGVAWTFAELGMLDRAWDLFQLIPDSPLAFRCSDIFNGAAGWGLTALHLYFKSGDSRYLTIAVRAGNYLEDTAEHNEKGACWRDEDGIVRLGFGLGGSGIAVFQLYLWRVTGEDRYLRLAREAMEFEIAHAQHSCGALVWGSIPDAAEHRPYWLRGGAGVATALVRFAQVLEEQHYMDLAHLAAKGCGVFFSVAPHLFEGLASMGDTLLDMYLATGQQHYLNGARQKAQQMLLYAIQTPSGIAFPGRFLLRISNDYGMGGAGIGLYLHRLVGLRPRMLHDILPEQLCLTGSMWSKSDRSAALATT